MKVRQKDGPSNLAVPEESVQSVGFHSVVEGGQDMRAQLHFGVDDRDLVTQQVQVRVQEDGSLTNLGLMGPGEEAYLEYRRQSIGKRDYEGPLALGDPGVSSSLWQEGRGNNNMFRDDRAWLPGDLVTVLVMESSEGKDEADTDTKTESSITAAISALLGYEIALSERNPNLKPESLLSAKTNSSFKGEGETNRKGSLRATISAIVVEVLPTGLLRIEGEKIISVDRDEQIIVISGIIRPRDVNADNEIDSRKIANVRIDYFGKGQIAESQRVGWLMRFLRWIWPL
jgi:flagellar L-ring protein precursor FlgH